MLRSFTALLLAACAVVASETNAPAPTHAEAVETPAPVEEIGLKARPQPPSEEELRSRLELVRTLRFQRSFDMAEKQVKDLVTSENPTEIRRLAMLEMAYIAQDAQQPNKAQQIFNDYLRKNPKDPSVPEVCLRQGLLYRQMGAHQQALSKFYQVMNHALSLKLDKFEYYQGLVLKAQTEIAETYFLQGKYPEAAEFFTRLLKLEAKGIDRATCHFKLIRSYAADGAHNKVIAQGESFADLYPSSSDVAEVRFLLADALKKVGRNRDAMQQVLRLLQSQQQQAEKHPELWAYWQQRTGNDIANELYKEGDYLSALEIYSGLANVNSSAAWQIPVWYQMGLVYERLKQTAKAAEMYDKILGRQAEARTNAPTQALITVLEMAQWRRNYIDWGGQADKAVEKLHLSAPDEKPAVPLDKDRAANSAPGEKGA